jgi:hypothetical protein
VAALPFALSGPAAAQSSLEDALKQYNGTTVRGYIQPLVDLFGANLNSGFFAGPAAPRSGLSFRLSLIAMASQVSDDQKTYTAPTPTGWTPSSFQTATIFGGTGTTVTNQNNPALQYRGSDGLIDASLFPLAVPQVSIGGIAGTEATVRFITTPSFGDSDEFPKTTLFGAGLRHNVGRYLGILPFDLGVGAMYSSFKVGDIVEVTGLTIGAQISKTFTVLTLYGGLAWEKSSMNLTYTSTDPAVSGTVDIDLDGANTFRTTAGIALKLAVARVFADVNFGSVTNFSGGLSFGL